MHMLVVYALFVLIVFAVVIFLVFIELGLYIESSAFIVVGLVGIIVGTVAGVIVVRSLLRSRSASRIKRI